jgi:phosphogluconate dehydratase
VPLLARVYPNGLADVNHFHAAGGMGFLIRELLEAGLSARRRQTVWGDGLASLHGRSKARRKLAAIIRASRLRKQRRRKGARPVEGAFQPNGGLKMLSGNIGNAVIKVSAVKPERS